MSEVDLSKFPMVEALITDLLAFHHIVDGSATTDAVVAKIKQEFDILGPFHFAKTRNLLVNNSGEEFACQFMAFYNEYNGQQVY